MAQQLSTNTFGCAKWIVSPTLSNGTHTTISSALTSASSGDTIFIRPGTYTENLTLKAGVNLTAFDSDSSVNGTGKVIISGTCTLTAAGSVTISSIQLQTNSATFLAVTGSAASIVNLNNCYLNCTNNSGITFSSSSSSSGVNIKDCYGDLGTTGIALFANSSAGIMKIDNSYFSNSGNSSTANTVSAGTLSAYYSTFFNPITSSSTGGIGLSYSGMDTGNNTCVTSGGSGPHTFNSSSFSSGTASAISISNTTGIYNCYVNSSNTNAITGAGAILYNNLIFSGTSQNINTTTQNGGLLKGGQAQAPSAGFIGEQITNSATSVATTSSTAKTVTSISLTPGIWDISAICAAAPTGGTALMSTHAAGIGTTNNTLTGTLGIDYFQTNVVDSIKSSCIPQIRATLTSTTTYYLVVFNTYTSTTCPTNGRITATRVG